MFSLSEIIFLAILALLLIGPKQLPEVARNIARFINEMRRASSSMFGDFDFKEQIKKQVIDKVEANKVDINEKKNV